MFGSSKPQPQVQVQTSVQQVQEPPNARQELLLKQRQAEREGKLGTSETVQRVAAIREIERWIGKTMLKQEWEWYIAAHKLLAADKFLEYCAGLIGDYHAGDSKLTLLMLRSALRVTYSSNSALLHIATTGKAGSGKNDLIENVTELLPTDNVVSYSSITSKDLFYDLEEEVPGQKKKQVNPYHFARKIICITEIADSKGYSGLKAFAELNERTKATHKATRTLALQVKGTRAIWIASVTGVESNDADKDQVNRRFINTVIEPESDAKQRNKTRVVTDGLVTQKNITDDPRRPIALAGFYLLFASKVRMEPSKVEVVEMIADLNDALVTRGHSISQIKQLYALMECAAIERQFSRGYVRIEKTDVLEAWWMSGFCSEQEILLGDTWYHATPPKAE